MEWLTLAEILPFAGQALPDSLSGLAAHVEREGWRQDPRRCRMRFGSQSGWTFHVSLLPVEVQARVALASAPAVRTADPEVRSNALWTAFERVPESARRKAHERLDAVQAVHALSHVTRQAAVALVAAQKGVATSSLWGWLALVDGVPRADWLPALAPRPKGRPAPAGCDPRAWDMLLADYLRPECRPFERCYADMLEAAREHGWEPVPSCKTLRRRLDREVPERVVTLARKGREAVARSFPAQRRDKSGFRPLQAVNADGHRVDVFVKWEDGTVGRPVITVFQDLYSGVLLAARVDRSENRETVRLALADVVGRWGIPEICFLDNGRHYASKWLTGGAERRFRFKVRDEDPQGIFQALGVEPRFVTPYHGQAKPIERAFRDLCDTLAKHPAFAGAYTGNSPAAKPANYGAKAVPIATFETVLAAEIQRHNAREGRRTPIAQGRSFLAVLQEALAEGAIVRRATEAQRRLLLLAAEGVTARKHSGELHLMGNRYWAEELVDHVGQRLTVRFDPAALTEPVAVYTADNRLICEAEPLGDVAFVDEASARAWARDRKAYLKHTRAALEAERRLSAEDVAALMPRVGLPPEPERKVMRMVAGQRAPEPDWEAIEEFGRGINQLAEGVLPFRRKEEGGR